MKNVFKIINGDSYEEIKKFPDNYFDSVITDPPYGLGKEPNAEEVLKAWTSVGYLEVKGSGFMGKEWDAFVPQPLFWKEVFRVLKHGGHVVAFFGTRTYDWGVMAMRLGGFEIRDCIQWLYGSGFPKSYNIAKGMEAKIRFDDGSGRSQKLLDGKKVNAGMHLHRISYEQGVEKKDYSIESRDKVIDVDFKTEQAKQWNGWGSALKPAHEDLVLARKPFKFSSDFVYLYENIVYNLKLQICQSKLFAKDVKEIFTLSQKDFKEVELDFAQWSVEKPFNTKADLLVLMDMLQLEMKQGNMTLNIVLLWLNTLVELWNVANIYTIETESSTITELRILNSLEWESIFQNIILLKDNKTNGLIANVLTAESLFSVLNLKLKDILTHSAKEIVTLKESEKTFVPNSEQIVLARKPLEKGLSIAENILKWGTGGINIDGSRISTNGETWERDNNVEYRIKNNIPSTKSMLSNGNGAFVNSNPQGRFPANLILTHHPECECKGMKKIKAIKGGLGGSVSMNEQGFGFKKIENGANAGGLGDENGQETIEDWTCHEDCPIKIMDEQSGESKSVKSQRGNILSNNVFGKYNELEDTTRGHSDSGGASRFFYVAKASKSERNFGLEEFEEKRPDDRDVKGMGSFEEKGVQPQKNFHPTVKPVKLMQYLVRLITPPNGKVLDPFNGSGTTGIACTLENLEYTGIELDADYCKISEARITNWSEIDEYEQYKIINQEDESPTNNVIQTKLFE